MAKQLVTKLSDAQLDYFENRSISVTAQFNKPSLVAKPKEVIGLFSVHNTSERYSFKSVADNWDLICWNARHSRETV